MPGAVVKNSIIERSVVFPNATIEDATVRDSIIDEQAYVAGFDCTGALLTAHTKLPNGGEDVNRD